MDAPRPQAQELRHQIEWALSRAPDPGDVLPLLHRLSRLAGDGTDDSLFAHRHLAELLVERDPWRAALYARRVLAHCPGDDRGWATLALGQTLLGNYKFAVTAYHRALAAAPKNPWYAHNLGHLLDIALDRAEEAIEWLRRAYESASSSGDIAASYAHALARAGRLTEAQKVLARAMKGTALREHASLLKWLERGAPADQDYLLARPTPVSALEKRRANKGNVRAARTDPDGAAGAADESRAPRQRAGRAALRRAARSPVLAEVDTVLARGLGSLPLDARQRARAKSLARDAMSYFSRPSGQRGAAAVQALAAAVAYAIVYVDDVPLTQAEVAGCFRVSVASLRGRFGELRTHLDLTPGDTRYATWRRR